MTLWLSTEILNWNVWPQDALGEDADSIKRAYVLWKHAELLLVEHSETLYLVDVITTLKRVINQRLQYIDNLYRLRTIPTRKRSHGLLEQLADVGIIKPIMLKRLMTIRNDIEHQDKAPPSKNRCEEFLEFTWYFLRSTDRLYVVVENFLYERESDENNAPYSILVSTGPKNEWVIELTGWVQPSIISETEKKNWLKIEVKETSNRSDFMQKYSQDELSSFRGYGKDPDDIWFTGILEAPEEYRDHLYRVYFSLL